MIGESLKAYRLTNHLTQTELGEILGVNKQTISKWERGYQNPSKAKMYEIGELLNISVATLTGQTEETVPQIIHRDFRVHDIGLNVLFDGVNDYKSFLFFADAFYAAYEYLGTPQLPCAIMMIDPKNGKSDITKEIQQLAIGFDFLSYKEINGQKAILHQNVVMDVQQIGKDNNTEYIFNVIINIKGTFHLAQFTFMLR